MLRMWECDRCDHRFTADIGQFRKGVGVLFYDCPSCGEMCMPRPMKKNNLGDWVPGSIEDKGVKVEPQIPWH